MTASRLDGSDALDSLLRDDEQLIWRGTPHRGRLLVDVVPLIGFVLVPLGMIGLFVSWIALLAIEFSGGDFTAVLPVMGGIALVVVLGVVAAALWAAHRRYQHAEYAATDRRLISFSGTIGRDYSSVEWGSVRDLEVTVGALDGLFGTGGVHVAPEGNGGLTFRYLDRPHDVAGTLDSIRSSGDPNGIRPHERAETPSEGPHTGVGARDPDGTSTQAARSAEHSHPREPRERTAGRETDDVSSTLERLLRDGEKLHWHYRPPVGTYLKQSVVGAVLSGILVLSIFYGLFVVIPVVAELGPLVESVLGVSTVVGVAGGWVLVLAIWTVGLSLGAYRAKDRLEFAATDRRVIKVGGWVGLDRTAVDWEHVTDVEVDRNLMTKLFGTAYIIVRSGGAAKTYRGGGVRLGPIADPLAALDRIEAVRRGSDDGAPILVGRPGMTPPAVRTARVESLSSQARTLLRDGEEVVWAGRPSFVPFTVPSLVGGLVLAGIGVGLYAIGWGLFAVFVVIGGISTAGKRLLAYRNVEYVATDQRLLSFGGAVGRDSSTVEWEDVHDVEVRSGAFDGLFDTGTLRFSRAGGATPAEQRETGGDSREAFTGIRFQRVANPRPLAELLERRRGQ